MYYNIKREKHNVRIYTTQRECVRLEECMESKGVADLVHITSRLLTEQGTEHLHTRQRRREGERGRE